MKRTTTLASDASLAEVSFNKAQSSRELDALDFTLPAALEATAPPGGARVGAR